MNCLERRYKSSKKGRGKEGMRIFWRRLLRLEKRSKKLDIAFRNYSKVKKTFTLISWESKNRI